MDNKAKNNGKRGRVTSVTGKGNDTSNNSTPMDLGHARVSGGADNYAEATGQVPENGK